MAELYKLSAFTETPDGGNPAGVWIGDELPDSETMLQIAKEVGFSETAFICPTEGIKRTIRYYSPEKEISFCGHATVASGVKLGEVSGEGRYLLSTAVGEVPVEVSRIDGNFQAALTSVEPMQREISEEVLEKALSALRWDRSELDDAISPVIGFAGAWHLIIAVSTKKRLNELDYNFEALKSLMLAEDLTTVQLIWRESADVFHARNPFPVGGVIEDPATGASSAALGGYLRAAGLIDVPCSFLIRQGEAMGRPSRIYVDVPESGGVVVSGTAVAFT